MNKLHALEPYFKYMPLMALKSKSRHLLFALTASMEGIIVGENKLGLFSKDFAKLSHLVAKGLFRGKEEAVFFEKLILGALSTMTGLLWLAHDQEKSGEIFDELLLRALFASEIPKMTFKHISEAFGIDASISLETLALLFAILAFSQEAKIEELIEGLRLRLLKNFEALDQALTGEAIKPIRLFISQGKRTLENRNYELFIKGLHELTHSYGIAIEKLYEDIQTSRRLFATLGTNFRMAARARDNVIVFAG